MTGVELTMALTGGGFGVGVIFWAGATYQRICGIETALKRLAEEFPSMEDFADLRAEVRNLKEVVDRIAAKVK